MNTYEWSLACWSRCFVPSTAMGDFSAMSLAVSRAAATTSSRPPSTTRDTRPIFSASAAEKLRPVKASSFTRLWFPVILGVRARVPMSAASPTSTSWNRRQSRDVSLAVYKVTLMEKIALEAV